jgi:hypothetical protein
MLAPGDVQLGRPLHHQREIVFGEPASHAKTIGTSARAER